MKTSKTIIFNKDRIVAIEEGENLELITKTVSLDSGLQMKDEESSAFLWGHFKKRMQDELLNKWMEFDSKLSENGFDLSVRDDIEINMMRAYDIPGGEEPFLVISKGRDTVGFYVEDRESIVDIIDHEKFFLELSRSLMSFDEKEELRELIWATISMLSYEDLPNISIDSFAKLLLGLHNFNNHQRTFLEYVIAHRDVLVKRICFSDTNDPNLLGGFKYHIFDPIRLKSISYKASVFGYFVAERSGFRDVFEAIEDAIPNFEEIRRI